MVIWGCSCHNFLHVMSWSGNGGFSIIIVLLGFFWVIDAASKTPTQSRAFCHFFSFFLGIGYKEKSFDTSFPIQSAQYLVNLFENNLSSLTRKKNIQDRVSVSLTRLLQSSKQNTRELYSRQRKANSRQLTIDKISSKHPV